MADGRAGSGDGSVVVKAGVGEGARGRFELGRTVITRGALDLACSGALNPADLLGRHHAGDWGDLCSADEALNERALEHGERLVSAYELGSAKAYVITEWDRSLTTVLLAEEY